MLVEAIRHNEGLRALYDKSNQRAFKYVIEISELKTQILEGRALEIRLNQVIRARDMEIGGLRKVIAALDASPRRTVCNAGDGSGSSITYLPWRKWQPLTRDRVFLRVEMAPEGPLLLEDQEQESRLLSEMEKVRLPWQPPGFKLRRRDDLIDDLIAW